MDTRNPDPTVCVSNTFFKVSPLYVDAGIPAIFVNVALSLSDTSSTKLGLIVTVTVALPALPETALEIAVIS